MIFDRYDVNNDGFLAVDSEFQVFLEEVSLYKSGHKHVSEELLKAYLMELDPNNQKKINW